MIGSLFPTGSSTLTFILSKTGVRVRLNPMSVCYTTCRIIQDLIVELVLISLRVTPLHGFYNAQEILLLSAVLIQAWQPKFKWVERLFQNIEMKTIAYLYSAIVRLKISLIMCNAFAKYIRVMIIYWTLMCFVYNLLNKNRLFSMCTIDNAWIKV